MGIFLLKKNIHDESRCFSWNGRYSRIHSTKGFSCLSLNLKLRLTWISQPKPVNRPTKMKPSNFLVNVRFEHQIWNNIWRTRKKISIFEWPSSVHVMSNSLCGEWAAMSPDIISSWFFQQKKGNPFKNTSGIQVCQKNEMLQKSCVLHESVGHWSYFGVFLLFR